MLFTALAIVASSWQGDTTESYKHAFTPVRNVSECQVTRIVDGDTIHCAGIESVRLIGMDTPERNQPPHGTLATVQYEERFTDAQRDAQEDRVGFVGG